jgi:hypothetical protein
MKLSLHFVPPIALALVAGCSSAAPSSDAAGAGTGDAGANGSSSGGPGTSSGGAAPGIDGGPGEADGGATPSDASSFGGDSSAEGDAGPGGEAGGGGDTRLAPYEVGRTWTFTGSQTSQGVTTPSTFTTTVAGQETYDGKSAFVITAGTVTSYASLDGDTTWVEYANTTGQWLPSTKAPVVDGASWTYVYSGTRTQTWHAVGPQTVQAGTFDDCWRIDYVVKETSQPGDVNYTILCRGVGEVLQEMSLSNGFQMHYELVSKSF